VLSLAVLIAARPAAATEATSREVLQISSDTRIVVLRGREIELEARADKQDDYGSLARRLTGDAGQAAALEDWNSAVRVTTDSWIRVPLAMLTPELRSLALTLLFPRDYRDGEDWIHLARAGVLSTYDEGLWQVAEWFAGNGEAFPELMAANGFSSPELREDQSVRIPGRLVHPAFRARLQSDDGALQYGSDPNGPFAGYRLKPGEALYSAVVVRFTGRTSAEDVRQVTEQLVGRSRIRDPRDIPVGFEVKIPLDLLEPEFLPAGHPRRREAEAQRAELDRVLAQQPVAGAGRGLEGLVLILDPGHGGRDLGTMNHGIWEHDYVYDVACRLKRRLETRTAATVVMTLVDKETGCVPSKRDKLVANHQGTILTTPAFLAKEEGEAKIGVNLRWYLSNSVYRQVLKQGVNPDRVVFVSLHADSRHPGLRGVMVYVPGASYRAKTYGSTRSVYAKYDEVKEKPTISFSKKDRIRSEAVSRKLAGAIVESFQSTGLPVHPYQPVRDKVIRGKQKWVPAVLRGNAVPTKVLVEMVNISNRADAKLLASAAKRETLAEALEQSLFRYFGEKPPAAGTTLAAE
jgi:N-acetylmuramoyl-L-alanine amidase